MRTIAIFRHLPLVVNGEYKETHFGFSHHLVAEPWVSEQFLSNTMVIFFTSNGIYTMSGYTMDLLTHDGTVVDPPVTLYMGRDKVESV